VGTLKDKRMSRHKGTDAIMLTCQGQGESFERLRNSTNKTNLHIEAPARNLKQTREASFGS